MPQSSSNKAALTAAGAVIDSLWTGSQLDSRLQGAGNGLVAQFAAAHPCLCPARAATEAAQVVKGLLVLRFAQQLGIGRLQAARVKDVISVLERNALVPVPEIRMGLEKMNIGLV